MTLTRRLAYLALFLAYAQIVFGAIVRITDSGMGCGDHWPKCNGLWLPPLDDTELIIEITHRWIASGLLVATLALVAVAYAQRHRAGIGGRGCAILLAMALLGVLTVTVIRAGGFGAMAARRDTVDSARSALAAAALAFVVVIMGGFTANVPGAAPACQGFPLCNGRVIAEGAAQTIHWAHRLLAFVLTLHVLGMVMAARKRESGAVRRATIVLFSVILIQILVAAILVSTHLPRELQSLHQALGTLIWLSAVVLAGFCGRGAGGAK